MELYEGLLTRRSIRKYNPEKKLTKDEILELIRAASYAPSAHNKQPWHFLVIQDAETLRTLRQIQPWTSFAKDAACAIVVCADEEECFHREKEGWNYAQIDGSLAAQNLLLACHAKGLGACFCGAAPMPMVVDNLRKKFRMPETMLPVAIITIGYPEETPKQPEDRLNPEKYTGKRFSPRAYELAKMSTCRQSAQGGSLAGESANPAAKTTKPRQTYAAGLCIFMLFLSQCCIALKIGFNLFTIAAFQQFLFRFQTSFGKQNIGHNQFAVTAFNHLALCRKG